MGSRLREEAEIELWRDTIEPQDVLADVLFDPFENGQKNISKLTQSIQLQEENIIYWECCLGEDGLIWLDHSTFILQDWGPKLEMLRVCPHFHCSNFY